MRKLFRIAGLAIMVMSSLMMLLPGRTAAARRSAVHELNYFQTSNVKVDGRDALRIEIGMDRGKLDYTVSTKTYLNRQIVVDLENTVPGELRKSIQLDSHMASRLRLSEVERHHTQVQVDLLAEADKDNYRVYTAEPDRQSHKPYRLVIDLLVPQTQGGSVLSIAGLTGHAIVIDPGHGGSDSGAVGPTGVMEKTVTLAVAKKVQAILEKSGARTIMTRTTDVDVYAPNDTAAQELQARCNVANFTPGAELFVSIHCNAFSNPAAGGMETYYYAPSDQGQRLAALLNEEVEKAGGLLNRGVKTANFYVIKHTNVPASLIELGFVTNEREEQLLSSESYQTTLAEAIARAIARYFS